MNKLSVRCGATLNRRCVITSKSGATFPLTGYAGGIRCEARDSNGALVATFTIAESNLEAGEFYLQMSAGDSEAITPATVRADIVFIPKSPSDPTLRTNKFPVEFTERITHLTPEEPAP